MKKIALLLILAVSSQLFYSCRKTKVDPEIEILNEWIWDVMNEIYLWEAEIDNTLYPTEMEDPEEFFYSILYSEDKFSWIVDDYEELINSFNNVEVASGISPYFIGIYGSEQVVIIVEYVVPGSPADAAGIERGDIIYSINDTEINRSNYLDLFYSEVMKLGFADYVEGSGITPSSREVSVTAEIIEENPVLYSEIIQYLDTDIGYLVYTGFSTGEDNKWIDSLDIALEGFMDQGIDELIIDLRYNPGGYVYAAQHLATVLGPADLYDNGNVFVNYEWNDLYQQYFLQQEGNDSPNLVIPFADSTELNMNLQRVYFLTSGHSASASELTIIGLKPYMDVKQIGEYTYGKCYGSVTIPDTEEPARHTWAMQPIVFKYSNSNGYTDFTSGLTPDVEVEDNLLDAKAFGDLQDPILAAALEDITGVSPISVKKSLAPDQDMIFDRMPDPVRELRSVSIHNLSSFPAIIKE